MRLLIAIVSPPPRARLGLAGEAFAQGPVKIGFPVRCPAPSPRPAKDMYSGCELFWEERGWQDRRPKLEVTLEATRACGHHDRQGAEARRVRPCQHAGGSSCQRRLRASAVHRGPGHSTIYPIKSADDRPSASAPVAHPHRFSAGGNLHPSASTRRRRSATGRSPSSPDYAFRLGDRRRFQKTFETTAGKIIQKIWVPLNVPGLRAYIGQIRKECDAVFVAGPRTMDSAVASSGRRAAQGSAHRPGDLQRRARPAPVG